MPLATNPKFYKWYAIAAFMLSGILFALIITPHDYSFHLITDLECIIILLAASFFTILAIKHTKSIIGKICFGLLQIMYSLFLVKITWVVIEHATGLQ